VRRLGAAATALRSPHAAAEVSLWTGLSWLIEVLMAMAVLRALGQPATAAAGALVVLAVNIAALVPGLPANVGPFEASAVVAVSAVGVTGPAALGFALLYHLIHTLPVTLAGLPDLRRGAARPATSAPSTPADPLPSVADLR
jgi:uncharacterized membrane protein YbhN (UPF0104 family)